MIRVMRLADDKSDKFWRIETLGPDFMINWGKTGTSGRYGLREFPDEQTCLAQASELVDIKTQKGYTDLHGFDPMSQYYYDDDSIGLHPLTSHPTFRKYFTEPFYYSSIADTDQVIIAAALAQIKITGQLHPSLYRLALLAIERLGRIAIARAGTLVTMTSETLASIARDLKRYWAAQR